MGKAELNMIKCQILTPFVVVGDVMIKIYQHNQFSSEPMFRFAFNTAFIQDSKYQVTIIC
jgi:C2 domain of PTEN tumour-suppressor protein